MNVINNFVSLFFFYLSSTVIQQLNRNEQTSCSFAAIFFTRGRFKVDLQCKNDSKHGQQLLSAVTQHHDTHHTYKFIPAIEITVI